MADRRAATTADSIARVRRCIATGLTPTAGDLEALVERVERLEEVATETAGLRRRASRNRAVADLAAQLCPGLGCWAAAHRLRQLATEPDGLPPELAGQLPKSAEQLYRIIRSSK